MKGYSLLGEQIETVASAFLVVAFVGVNFQLGCFGTALLNAMLTAPSLAVLSALY